VVIPAVIAGAGFIEAVRPAGSTYQLQVTGVAGVPANASAVVLNLTSASASGSGFLTAWPCGEPRPNASNLNYGAAAPVANSAVVRVGSGGKVCIFNGDGATELIVDINGWFASGSGYTSATPARLLDTRRADSTVDGQADGEGRRAAGSTYTLQVSGRAGVPGNVSAVVLNLTSDQASGTGFVTAFPCGEGRPNASNLNFRAGTAAANSAIVKVGSNGTVCLFVGDADTHLIADINGWFGSGSGYSAATPARLLDTRRADSTVDGQADGGGPRATNDTLQLQVTGRAGVPGNATAVVLNLTSDQPGGTGFVTAYPCGEVRPNASNLNYGPGMAVANSAIVKVGANGRVCLYTGDTSTQLIADVNGWFTAGSGYTPITPTRLLDTRSLPSGPPGTSFVEAFTGDTGLERFRIGVFHRNMGTQELGSQPVLTSGNNGEHGGSWTGDHDLSCGSPDTQRNLSSTKVQDLTGANGWQPAVDFHLDKIVYLCKDHMMTSMGAVDGYSVLWFSPNRTFNGHTRVSWDATVTDLLSRQWWEVMIVPASSPDVAAVDWLAGTANLPDYPSSAIVFGNGPVGGTLAAFSNNTNRVFGSVCSIDPEGCDSKVLRRPFSITDNGNGTITFQFNSFAQTVPGSFPSGDFKVMFKDHNYTPDKDGTPVGHTWHWDNIVVD
jgi:hypothetical protein